MDLSDIFLSISFLYCLLCLLQTFLLNLLACPSADDSAPAKQLVSSEGESKALPAAEDVTDSTAATSSTSM